MSVPENLQKAWDEANSLIGNGDPEKALDILREAWKDCKNNSQYAKTHRYGVCNAMESLLIAESVAQIILPQLAKIYTEKNVEMRGCDKSRAIVDSMIAASEQDWSEEYLAPILSIKIVTGIDEAIEHINRYSSKHTESIVTEDFNRGRRFIAEVDSSSVMINASTRFADGFEYGLGAEIGISTDKIHARGPVGLEGLTSQKWVVFGDGQIRE